MATSEPLRHRLVRVVPMGIILLAAVLPFARACYSALHPPQPRAEPPPPLPVLEVPAVSYTADAGAMVVPLLLGGLPKPDERQKRAPCDPDVGEEEFKGVCWLRLSVKPPCPSGKAWEQGGKCYLPVLRAERLPSSGTDRGASGVAGP